MSNRRVLEPHDSQAVRNNGRAAMVGIIGMMIHEALTGNPLVPLQPEASPGRTMVGPLRGGE